MTLCKYQISKLSLLSLILGVVTFPLAFYSQYFSTLLGWNSPMIDSIMYVITTAMPGPSAVLIGAVAIAKIGKLKLSGKTYKGKLFAKSGIALGMIWILMFFIVFPMLPQKFFWTAQHKKNYMLSNNMFAILEGAKNYARNHKDIFPDNLVPLIINKQVAPSDLINPFSNTQEINLSVTNMDSPQFTAQLESHCDFIYIGKGLMLDDRLQTIDGDVIIIYTKHLILNRYWVVGFANGLVSPISSNDMQSVFIKNNEARAKLGLPPVQFKGIR